MQPPSFKKHSLMHGTTASVKRPEAELPSRTAVVPQTHICNTGRVFSSLAHPVMESLNVTQCTLCYSCSLQGTSWLLPFGDQLCVSSHCPSGSNTGSIPVILQRNPPCFNLQCSSHRATSQPPLHGLSRLESQQPHNPPMDFLVSNRITFRFPRTTPYV